MATLHELTVPDELLKSIEARAKARGVSVEEQVVQDLALVRKEVAEEEALLAEIRRDREAMAAEGIFLTDEFLNKAKRWGRE